MASKSFPIELLGRIALLLLISLAVAWLAISGRYYAGLVIATLLLFLSALELWRFVNRTNEELSRFLDAARYADFSQRFNFAGSGSGFDELGEVFTEILENLRKLRSEQEADRRRLKALVEQVPVPLLSIHQDDSISMHNNAARRLFGASSVSQLRDLRQFGSGFHRAVVDAVPGKRELVTFVHDGMEQQMTLASSEVIVGSAQELLISLQDIQSELDFMQAEAWQDLVRVLTHEIMNSITPISSLARTATDLADDLVERLDDESPVLDDVMDIQSAVSTVARRSDSLTQFVNSYRQLTRLAPPEKDRVPIADLFEHVVRLALAEWSDDRVDLTVQTTPEGLEVMADRDLLEPTLLNLLRNAWQATADTAEPRISLTAKLNRRGHVVIEVSDNGPGIAADITRKIFVPFFTTKKSGSGVGLALTRQVMIAHRGYVTLGESDTGGARFSLIF
jgi:nitrogen fixation/metabolism regulation signal transduction histidine kinase